MSEVAEKTYRASVLLTAGNVSGSDAELDAMIEQPVTAALNSQTYMGGRYMGGMTIGVLDIEEDAE